jgi:hypothetical protein
MLADTTEPRHWWLRRRGAVTFNLESLERIFFCCVARNRACRPFRPMNLESKRVLVTGADGFIGSHLVEQLLGAGAQVTALAQYNSFNFWGWLEDIPALNEIQVVTCSERLNGSMWSPTKVTGWISEDQMITCVPSRNSNSASGNSFRQSKRE